MPIKNSRSLWTYTAMLPLHEKLPVVVQTVEQRAGEHLWGVQFKVEIVGDGVYV